MEDSILISTKQIVGLSDEDDSFDIDILTLINSAFANLNHLGLQMVFVEDAETKWSDLDLHHTLLSWVRTYVPLKVQMGWDPPTMGYLVDAKEKQIAEFEWRITSFQETELT